MLTLTGVRTIGKTIVYRDDADPLMFYYLPGRPSVALDENGKPSFSLVWYRRDLGRLSEEERRTRLGGGILTMSVELAISEQEVAEIRTTLAGQLAAPGSNENRKSLAESLKLSVVPIKSGHVTVGILGESGAEAGEFVLRLVGAGKVGMSGKQRASFMAKLTMDGAVLLWKEMEKDLPAIIISYELVFEHRLEAMTMWVHCDASKSYSAIQSQWRHITDDASWSVQHRGNTTYYSFSRDQSMSASDRLAIVAHDAEASWVRIDPGTASVEPETIDKLTQIGEDMIKEFLATTFLDQVKDVKFEPSVEPTLATELATQDGKKYGHHGINYYNFKESSVSATANLDHTVRTRQVLEQTEHLPNDLKGMLRGLKADDFRVQIDLDTGWYKYLNVQLLCTADFAEEPVDLVKAHLSYKGEGALGHINKVADFVFRKDSVPQFFATYLAAEDQLAYDYEIDVHYKGSAQTYSYSGKSEETILVLDTDRMGILRVDVQAGIIDWDRIRQVLVQMSYGSGPQRKEIEFILDAKQQTYRWIEVIGKPVDEPYTYTATFVDKNSQRWEMEPVAQRGPRLIISSDMQDSLEVALVPAGGFGPGNLLQQVVVALRYKDKENDYLVDDIITLSKDGEMKLWAVPLRNKNLRRYEYRVTVFYSDSVVREDDWRQSESNILPVGDPFGMRVQISPYLLKFPPGMWAFATVNLTFDDLQTRIHAEKTLEITDFSKPLFWRFRLGAPERHTYRYQLTLYKPDGTRVVLQPVEETKEILVLPPPPV